MTAQERLTKIEGLLKSGTTIYISTCLKSICVTPKTMEKWKKLGIPLFKASEKSLYVARGKNYDCIDYCKITAIV